MGCRRVHEGLERIGNAARDEQVCCMDLLAENPSEKILKKLTYLAKLAHCFKVQQASQISIQAAVPY